MAESDKYGGLSAEPRFELDGEGKTLRVSVATEDYLRLLVNSSITDPAQWPEEFREGAALLARIREIEAQCKLALDGEFDYEQLGTDLQDEYDSAIVKLERLTDSGERFSIEDIADDLQLDLDEVHTRVH